MQHLSNIFRLKIRGRLMFGFGLMCLVLVGAVGLTVFEVGNVKSRIDRIAELRVPTAATCLTEQADTLRGEVESFLASIRKAA